jgi:hypothetical protein
MRVGNGCYTKKSPFRYGAGVQASAFRRRPAPDFKEIKEEQLWKP